MRKKKFNYQCIFLCFGILFMNTDFILSQNYTVNEKDSLKTLAKDLFELRLSDIDTISSNLVFDSKRLLSVSRVEKLIVFFETLTSIPSSADYSMFGRFPVPREDYLKWKKWYEINSENLYWSSSKDSIFVCKPPH